MSRLRTGTDSKNQCPKIVIFDGRETGTFTETH